VNTSAFSLVLRAGVRDLARGRWVLAYAAALALIAEGLFLFGGTGPQVVLSLLNATLLLVPLMALVFGTTHFYASRDFIELLLAQPLSRTAVFGGLFAGLMLPLAGAFVVGIGVPLVLHGAQQGAGVGALVALAAGGVFLTAIFAALAMLIALSTDDRLRGMFIALGAWFVLTIAYDGAVLTLVAVLGDWPLDRALLALMVANPVDLARVLVLHSLDAAALLGFTGALFRQVFGTTAGPTLLVAALALWGVVPFLFARRRFARRDF
jgi:Cu-processing system permease protein